MLHMIVGRRGRAALVAAAAIASMSLLASCNNEKSASAPPASADDKVLATVEGTDIHQTDFDTARLMLPQQYQSMPDTVIMPALMDQLIDRRVVVLAAEKAGMDKDPDVQRQMAQAREDVLQNAYLREAAKKSITDAQIKSRYEEKLKSFVPQTEVRARHILTKDQDSAKIALERIKSGEDFAVVAGETSIDSSAQHGGDLGYFTRDQMVKEFSDVAFNLKVGQVSAPFKSQYGWHIVKLEDKRQTTPPTLEQAEPGIRNELMGEFVRSKLAEMTSAAKIERFYTQPEVQAPEAAPSQAPVISPESSAAPSGGGDALPSAETPAPTDSDN